MYARRILCSGSRALYIIRRYTCPLGKCGWFEWFEAYVRPLYKDKCIFHLRVQNGLSFMCLMGQTVGRSLAAAVKSAGKPRLD